MFDLIRTLFQRGQTRTVYECRQCGRTLEDETGACPKCGWVGIAVYEVET
jgi:rubrerythrin